MIYTFGLYFSLVSSLGKRALPRTLCINTARIILRATMKALGEWSTTYAVGHIALGYITGKASSKFLETKMSIPLALTLSILPDIDLLIPGLQHGGPTHSVILLLVLAFPAVLVWRKRAIPYLVVLASHPLLGDYLTRPSRTQGVQLLYPLTSSWFSAGSEAMKLTYVYIEFALFAAFLMLMLASRDLSTLLERHKSNLLLAIPISTALLPVFTEFPIPVPPELIIPHLILILLLTIPILIDLTQITKSIHLRHT